MPTAIKPTPGPFHVRTSPWAKHIYDIKGNLIASLPFFRNLESEALALANAHRLSKAPELEQALVACRAVLIQSAQACDGIEHPLIMQIDRALSASGVQT